MFKFTFILILSFVLNVWAGRDFYQILGVPRNVDDAQLQKAFKQLSIQYHPDKNEQDPQTAKNRFQEIVNAFEVLKDPKQRQVYDRSGEEGLNEYIQQQGQQNAGFGGWGEYFGGHRFRQQAEDYFSQSDVYQIDMESMGQFYRRRDVWIILFYKSNQQQSRMYKDDWRDFATQFHGIFRVAAINCISEEELCEQEFQNYQSPVIIVYPANIQGEPKQYTGEYNMNKWTNAAVNEMENFVRFVGEKNYQDFIDSDIEKHQIIVFTEQQTTPPLLRALSKDFLGQLVFGEIRSSDTILMQKFGVTQFPTLLVLNDPDNYRGVIYDGVFQQDSLVKFLREYANSQNNRQQQIKIETFTNEMAKSQGNCGKNDQNLCFFGIYQKDSLAYINEVMQNVAVTFKDSPVKFFQIPAENIEYENIFHEEPVFPSFIVIKGKRGTYYRLTGENLDAQEVQIKLDAVIGGSGQFQQMGDSLFGNIFNVKSDL